MRYTVKLWDVSSRSQKTELQRLTGYNEHENNVGDVDFSPDGRLVAASSPKSTITIWDVTTGKAIATLSGHSGAVKRVTFSPDGNTLASGSGDGQSSCGQSQAPSKRQPSPWRHEPA